MENNQAGEVIDPVENIKLMNAKDTTKMNDEIMPDQQPCAWRICTFKIWAIMDLARRTELALE